MCVGNVTIVAWVMVLIRKRYFVQHLESIKKRERAQHMIRSRLGRWVRFPALSSSTTPNSIDEENIEITVKQPSIIHSLPEHPHHARFDPSEGIGAALVGGGSAGISLGIALRALPQDDGASQSNVPSPIMIHTDEPQTRISVESNRSSAASFDFVQSHEGQEGIVAGANDFTSSPQSGVIQLPMSPQSERHPMFSPVPAIPPALRHRRGVPVPRRQTVIVPPVLEPHNGTALGQRGKDQGLGGFPGPIKLLKKITRYYTPRIYRSIERIFTEHRKDGIRKNSFKWLGDDFQNLIINRNSDFDTEELDDDELERLGGLEYRALDFLSWLVILYFIGVQLISIVLIAPWLSSTRAYDSVFEAQPRKVNKSWFVAFQVIGSYTGGGMSLVDAGMVPFQRAYLMIFSMIFAILAGNHGLPIFLRLIIWICTKFVEDDSPNDRMLHFLLDHPRRCFIYLFPSHVTWFLAATLAFFTIIEWVSFIVLDIGLSVTESLSAGVRVVAGFFQSFAIRASGFGIVSLSSLAPAFQFLCVIMMYIAVYPVSMSIRSTNVYEERSLGVFEVGEENEDEEPTLNESTPRRQRVFQYFGWHLRRQVAYDIWWLVSGIFLICIIERTKIMDDDNAPWFNLFRILFELVSAFGGIGLTLGIPTENFAFSGAFGPLSKLVVIVIMVRGRHRGLPVAVDRAILLPQDVVPAKRDGDATGTTNAANGDASLDGSILRNSTTKETQEKHDFRNSEKGQ
ncbi:cation transport protein-domain-containing protein [Irpex rosettiformis]|uniref:Cation transport protein-domain-containing protein n=1 Tax=Irpex rosettiformis TaxID=378272 RepID=A0ACB8TUR2_9APHY|nr:cation transport protein-domain-containing protein [Irpex rosettiformis]